MLNVICWNMEPYEPHLRFFLHCILYTNQHSIYHLNTYASFRNAIPMENRKFLYNVNKIKLGNRKLIFSTNIELNTVVINTPQTIIGITTGFHLFSGYLLSEIKIPLFMEGLWSHKTSYKMLLRSWESCDICIPAPKM